MNIAIIGAGPAGCAAAYAHKINGHNVTLLEKRSSIGGRTRCYRSNHFTLDTGAGFVTNFYPRLMEMVKNLKFEDQLYHMHRSTGLYKDGQLAPLNVSSALSFAQFPFLTVLNKIKMMMWIGGLTLKRGTMDLADPATLSDLDTRSIADCAREQLNEEIYHTIIRPGIEPFWYFSCEEVSQSLVLALSSQAAGAQFYSFPGGIDTICKHLTQNINVHCNASVQEITEHDAGYKISHQTNDISQVLNVDKVIVATTASIADRLTHDLSERSVTSSMRSFLASQRYASNIHACIEIPKFKDRPLAGALFPCSSARHDLAALSFHRSKYPSQNRDTELVSIFLSDPGSRKHMDLADEQLYSKCWSLAKEVCSELPEEYVPFHLTRRAEAIPVHEVGRYKQAALLNTEQLGKSLRFCGDYLTTATIEGALHSGLQTVL